MMLGPMLSMSPQRNSDCVTCESQQDSSEKIDVTALLLASAVTSVYGYQDETPAPLKPF